MIDSRMPKTETIRRYIHTELTDPEILEIAEWLLNYSGGKFIKPNNRLLHVLIKWEESKKSGDK